MSSVQVANRGMASVIRPCLQPVLFLLLVWASSAEGATQWLKLQLGIIGPAAVEMLERATEIVTTEGYQGVIVQLDTPGGALDATRLIVQQLLNAPFPIIVWVGPGGAHAGSAGAFITLAATVAVMAPGTNIGAAHPVQAGGKDVDEGKVGEKIINDTVAFMESIAEVRGRDLEMARSFVLTSMSITAEEALEHKVIDLIAPDIPTLLADLHGRVVTQNKNKIEIATQGYTIIPYEPSLRQKALELLANPNLFYLLFLAGIIGLGFELTHPGALFPGIIGAICLILALISTAVLPVSFGAAFLIVLGFGLLVAEVFVPSFGLLGLGGIAAFLIGSVFLVDPSNVHGLRVSWYTIAPGAITVGALATLIGYLVTKVIRAEVKSGAGAIIGQQGVVLRDFNPEGEGQIRVMGEVWAARSTTPDLKQGESVKIIAMSGLQLTIEREQING